MFYNIKKVVLFFKLVTSLLLVQNCGKKLYYILFNNIINNKLKIKIINKKG